jgi:heme-degrading monooxygenase HmoA
MFVEGRHGSRSAGRRCSVYVEIRKAPVKRGTNRDQLEEIWKDLMADFRSLEGFHILYPIADDNVTEAGAITLWDSKDAADAGELVQQRAVVAFQDLYEQEPSIEGYYTRIVV